MAQYQVVGCLLFSGVDPLGGGVGRVSSSDGRSGSGISYSSGAPVSQGGRGYEVRGGVQVRASARRVYAAFNNHSDVLGA